MAEEIITSSGLAAALGAKLLYDVCGPTAKYIGGQLASYAEAGVENLKRVFAVAAQRLHELEKGEGQVPPRLLKDVLEEGYFCEDKLETLYLGGVLASAKGPVTRDDRAVAYCSLLSSLSSYQIRTHYILYSCILRFHAKGLPDLIRWIRRSTGATVMIRETDYIAAMDFSELESPSIIGEHAFIGLQQKGLSEGGISVVRPNSQIRSQPQEDFRYFYPTVFGIELFLWGLGLGDRGIQSYSPELLSESLPPTITPMEIQLGRVSYG